MLDDLSEPLAFLLAIISVAVAFLPNLANPIGGFLLPTLAFAIAIIPHELAHRGTARRFGCWSRFVLYPPGFYTTLAVNLVMGFIVHSPLLFIAGYTAISCAGYTRRDEGMISLAGPLTNIAIALISLAYLRFPVYLPLFSFFYLLLKLNAFVAFFNLLPLGPLDGAKIFRWNIAIWAILIIIAGWLWLA
ncbi:MAG: peptidase M50 [Thermoproteus sp. AZ2]|jgi:Zn-dependent protease|uniref:Peptidase M50 n=1 Tax=Thermoproteus sp. AZ2 TaxID=1609232 RepID=A0ACC6UYL3_9CREN